MWFIGLIIGLVVGAAVEDFEGAVYGAALGALAGFRVAAGAGPLARRATARLEQEVAELRRNLHAHQSQPSP